MSQDLLSLKIQKLHQLEENVRLRKALPHLHSFKFYPWAREYWESRNRESFIRAANQIGKSSFQIRKNIHWATETTLWDDLWPGLHPNQFWYFYPSLKLASKEFLLKWRQFLPREDACTPDEWKKYGWKEKYKNSEIAEIRFNSGVSLFFQSYKMDEADLQAGTVFMTSLDEEAPLDVMGEVEARMNASDGYLSAVFTPTLGQVYWIDVMENRSRPQAWRKTVSLYDCQVYEDGTKSHWTPEKIQRAKSKCTSPAEVQRRIYGIAATVEGRKYFGFELERNTSPAHPLPKDWHVYVGVDPGSGGTGKYPHPAAIFFLAVSPDHRQGRVFRTWRGDGIDTTDSDVLKKYLELKANLLPVQNVYDHSRKDFFLLATRLGIAFTPADKAREAGEALANTLFRAGMVKIQREVSDNEKLIGELLSLRNETRKQEAQDNLADAMRYAFMSVPWDLTVVQDESFEAKEPQPKAPVPPKSEADLRREYWLGKPKEVDEIDAELDAANDLYLP